MSVLEERKAAQRIPEFRDWETAARRSRSRMAISAKPIRVKLTGPKINYSLNIYLVKPLGKDPYAVYASCLIKIPFTHYRPTTREVDSVPFWKAF